MQGSMGDPTDEDEQTWPFRPSELLSLEAGSRFDLVTFLPIHTD